jgi:hypothetical protein
MQPRKYSKEDFKARLRKKSRTTSKVLDKPAVLSYEELGGLLMKQERLPTTDYILILMKEKRDTLFYIEKPQETKK